MNIRNIAIIAHVDHGKTTLTDAIMTQCGHGDEGSMDSNALEQERGITIYAKNTSVSYKGTKINIVDTPGHADFGSEVERVLRSIDAVLLVVDAQEGPMPQTRFVLKKSLELGLQPIVIINKIDKPAADPARVHDQVLELFIELGANDSQIDFPTIYAIGRQGIAKKSLNDDSKDLTPLLDTILEKVKPANAHAGAGASSSSPTAASALTAQVFNLGYDNFLGRLAVCRIYSGTIKDGQNVWVKDVSGKSFTGKITKLFTFDGKKRIEIKQAESGDIITVAGIPDIYIGETICDAETTAALPAITVDEPTISLQFLVNNSPFAGREGTFVTGRQIRERLERELETNVGLKVDFSSNEYFTVYGRGELHIAILVENMRREGYELQISQPKVIVKEENGEKLEPFEELIIDTPQEYSGTIIETLGKRKGIMNDMKTHGNQVRMVFEIPTRGLLGYRNVFTIDTKGEGIMSSRVVGFKPYAGEIEKRETGSMTSMASGRTFGFSLWNLQDRGRLFIGPAVDVYEGMVIGDTSKGDDLDVNPCKGKQLSNMRSSGKDEALTLVPPYELSIERGMELMRDDEYLEITPKSIRLRKKFLTNLDRARAMRKDGSLK
ncbi:MAG: translational GTPase TypA [Patescibacteria group bacterium]|nr:translational GTPase TypA [Patescibacteria group bacterium]MDE2172515.1 translational GTPase TypA [Patescibacteria group bacterium]